MSTLKSDSINFENLIEQGVLKQREHYMEYQVVGTPFWFVYFSLTQKIMWMEDISNLAGVNNYHKATNFEDVFLAIPAETQEAFLYYMEIFNDAK